MVYHQLKSVCTKAKQFAFSAATLITATLLTACGPEGYVIEGTLSGAPEGATVYLCRGDNFINYEGIDSALISDGHFIFEGHVDAPELLTLKVFPDSTRGLIGERGVNMRPIIPLLVDNSHIRIEAELDSLPLDFNCYSGSYDYGKANIYGSTLHAGYADYKQAATAWIDAKSDLTSDFYKQVHTDEGRTAQEAVVFATALDSLQQVLQQGIADIIRTNADNIVGVYALKECMTRLDAPTLAELIPLFPETLKAECAEVFAKADTVARCAIGAPYIDVDLIDRDGNAFRLSDCLDKGKYTLVEFWASWCGPCRGEIPHLKYVYSRYHNEFDIVSISMDAKKEDWLKALDSEGMTWTQGTDLKAFEGELNKVYNFDGIPYCVLLNPEGIIVHHNARGPELDKLLIEKFGNRFDDAYRVYKH